MIASQLLGRRRSAEMKGVLLLIGIGYDIFDLNISQEINQLIYIIEPIT